MFLGIQIYNVGRTFVNSSLKTAGLRQNVPRDVSLSGLEQNATSN